MPNQRCHMGVGKDTGRCSREDLATLASAHTRHRDYNAAARVSHRTNG